MFAAGRTEHPRGEAFEIVTIDLGNIELGVNDSLLIGQGDAGPRGKSRDVRRVDLQQDRQRPDLTAGQTVHIQNRLERFTGHEPGEWGVGPVRKLLTVHKIRLGDDQPRQTLDIIQVGGSRFAVYQPPAMRLHEQ